MRNCTDFDPKTAELVDGIPTALNQSGYRLTAAELAHFNGRPKKAERIPKMKTEAGTDDKATASRDQRRARGLAQYAGSGGPDAVVAEFTTRHHSDFAP